MNIPEGATASETALWMRQWPRVDSNDCAYFCIYAPKAKEVIADCRGSVIWVYDKSGARLGADGAADWLIGRIKPVTEAGLDLRVKGFTGTKDIAHDAMKSVVEALRAADAPLDLTFQVLPDGDHNYKNINQYLYNVLPILF